MGSRVAVFWADDDAWYTGLVTAYSKKHRKHTVQYDDGDIEVKNLARAKYPWRYDFSSNDVSMVEVKLHEAQSDAGSGLQIRNELSSASGKQ